MKTRLGFVSNSSSSSYTIAYKPQDLKFCKHCGRGDQDPLEMVREVVTTKPLRSEDWMDNENRIIWDSVDSRIEALTYQIEGLQASKDKLMDRPAGAAFIDDYSLESCTDEELKDMESYQPKVWEQIHHYDTMIRHAENCIRRLKRYKLEGFSVCSVNLKYGESAATKIKGLVDRGLVSYAKDVT